MNKMLLSEIFFIAGIVLLVIASLSKLAGWSIHKRTVIGKMDGNQTDIEKVKTVMNRIFNYLAILGCLSAGASIILEV